MSSPAQGPPPTVRCPPLRPGTLLDPALLGDPRLAARWLADVAEEALGQTPDAARPAGWMLPLLLLRLAASGALVAGDLDALTSATPHAGAWPLWPSLTPAQRAIVAQTVYRNSVMTVPLGGGKGGGAGRGVLAGRPGAGKVLGVAARCRERWRAALQDMVAVAGLLTPQAPAPSTGPTVGPTGSEWDRLIYAELRHLIEVVEDAMADVRPARDAAPRPGRRPAHERRRDRAPSLPAPGEARPGPEAAPWTLQHAMTSHAVAHGRRVQAGAEPEPVVLSRAHELLFLTHPDRAWRLLGLRLLAGRELTGRGPRVAPTADPRPDPGGGGPDPRRRGAAP